jgi:hypothetical protein
MPSATALACSAGIRLQPIDQNVMRFYERACQSQLLARSTGRSPKSVESAIAATTRDPWLDSEEYSALHSAELMRILNEGEPRDAA